MADKTWKAVERRICRWFNMRRTPLSGRNSQHGTSADCIPDDLFNGELVGNELYIEIKHRKKHTAVTLWDDTAEKAKKENKTPVVCLAEKNRKGFWLLIHCDDFLKI